MMRLLLLGLLVVGCATPYDGRATLLSRGRHQDYEKATFSFEHGVRDDPELALTYNDWDLHFGGRDNGLGVTMVTDDRSRILDLGPMTWADIVPALLPDLPAHEELTREEDVQACVGHIYLVHTADTNSDFYSAFRVEKLISGDRVEITWRKIRDASCD